jgi:hypothetical protein
MTSPINPWLLTELSDPNRPSSAMPLTRMTQMLEAIDLEKHFLLDQPEHTERRGETASNV